MSAPALDPLRRTTDHMAERLAEAIDRDLSRALEGVRTGDLDLGEYLDRRREVQRSASPGVLAALRRRGWLL